MKIRFSLLTTGFRLGEAYNFVCGTFFGQRFCGLVKKKRLTFALGDFRYEAAVVNDGYLLGTFRYLIPKPKEVEEELKTRKQNDYRLTDWLLCSCRTALRCLSVVQRSHPHNLLEIFVEA